MEAAASTAGRRQPGAGALGPAALLLALGIAMGFAGSRVSRHDVGPGGAAEAPQSASGPAAGSTQAASRAMDATPASPARADGGGRPRAHEAPERDGARVPPGPHLPSDAALLAPHAPAWVEPEALDAAALEDLLADALAHTPSWTGVIVGTVRTPAGVPLAGAIVCAEPADSPDLERAIRRPPWPTADDPGSLAALARWAATVAAARDALTREVRTAADGAYRIDGLPLVPVELRAKDPSGVALGQVTFHGVWSIMPRPGAGARVDLMAFVVGALRIRAVDPLGRAVKDASIGHAMSREEWDGCPHPGTNAGGRAPEPDVEELLLPAGPRDVSIDGVVEGTRLSSASRIVDVPAGVTLSIDMVLEVARPESTPATVSLFVRVPRAAEDVDVRGLPFVGEPPDAATVGYHTRPFTRSLVPSDLGLPGRDEVLPVHSFAPGTRLALTAARPGRTPTVVRVVDVGKRDAVIDLDVRLDDPAPPRRIPVRVLASEVPDGDLEVSVLVALRNGGVESRSAARAGPDAWTVTLGPTLEQRAWRIVALALSSRTKQLLGFAPIDGDTTEVTLAVGPPGAIEVHLDGPGAQATLAPSPVDPGPLRISVVGPDMDEYAAPVWESPALLPEKPAGRYEVRVHAAGRVVARAPASVEPGRTTSLSISVPVLHRLRLESATPDHVSLRALVGETSETVHLARRTPRDVWLEAGRYEVLRVRWEGGAPAAWDTREVQVPLATEIQFESVPSTPSERRP